MTRTTLIWATMLLAVSFLAEPGRGADTTLLKTEHFDRDPVWDASNNRITDKRPVHVVQDFGYSPTHHAGGKGAGEIGGRVMRSVERAITASRSNGR